MSEIRGVSTKFDSDISLLVHSTSFIIDRLAEICVSSFSN